MTKVKINPGVCGLETTVIAETEDDMDVIVNVKSACPAVMKMFAELGNEFDSYEICLAKPGENEFYKYASEHFPGHASCPTIAGIIKCMEVECKLALPKSAEIIFESED